MGAETLAYSLEYDGSDGDSHSLVTVKFLDATSLVVTRVTLRSLGRDIYAATALSEGVARRIWERVFSENGNDGLAPR